MRVILKEYSLSCSLQVYQLNSGHSDTFIAVCIYACVMHSITVLV